MRIERLSNINGSLKPSNASEPTMSGLSKTVIVTGGTMGSVHIGKVNDNMKMLRVKKKA